MTRPHAHPRVVTPSDRDWPDYAPAWAQDARFDAWPGHTVLFERLWMIPSQFRDAADFAVLKVQQTFEAVDGGAPQPESAPRVVVGDGEVWVDWRANEVATTLRQIANALDPQGGAEAATA